MGDVVNLRQARKARARRDKETQAAANRALHGRTKAERLADKAESDRSDRLLDGARREGLSMAHWLLSYTLAPDYLARRPEFRGAHLALARAAADRGELLLGGAVGDPPESALLLFTDADAARRFAEADPYVAERLVADWSVRQWTTVVGASAATPVRDA